MWHGNYVTARRAWGRARQAIALPVYTVGLLLGYLRAAVRWLAELAFCVALVATLMLIRLMIRIPDMDGIDG